MPGDALTVSFREALRGNEVTVGDGYYFLFREPSAVNLLPSLGVQAAFKLNAASAFHRPGSGELAPANVDTAQLSVNFAQRTFSTSLQVSAAGIAPQAAQFSGSVDPGNGIFVAVDPGATGTLGTSGTSGSLAGALTLDGRKAGYFFSFPVGVGSLQGATLWSR